MKFDKNKNEFLNLKVLKREIKKDKSSYARIIIDTIFTESDSDKFRTLIKEKVAKQIESKMKKL